MPPFASKLSPEQWAEARRQRAEGATYDALSARFGVRAAAIGKRARKEGWAWPGESGAAGAAAPRAKARSASPGTIDTRRRLARHLYGYLETRIKMMETNMQKKADAAALDPDAAPSTFTKGEQENFSALIHSINQVTEMASEPDSAAPGRRKSINPELTALSDELDAAALAAASAQDEERARLAEQLAKAVGPA
jgi:hypothetical protein